MMDNKENVLKNKDAAPQTVEQVNTIVEKSAEQSNIVAEKNVEQQNTITKKNVKKQNTIAKKDVKKQKVEHHSSGEDSQSKCEYAFELTPELCIQCHACESACKNWRHTENFLSWRKVQLVEEGQFPNTKIHYYSLACMHCVHPACMEKCPVKAISKNENGIVLVDSGKCIGCKLCKKACPYDIPVFGKDRKMQKCDMCAGITPEEQQSPCVRMCPTRALKRVVISVEEKQKIEEEYLHKLQKH